MSVPLGRQIVRFLRLDFGHWPTRDDVPGSAPHLRLTVYMLGGPSCSTNNFSVGAHILPYTAEHQ